MADKKISALSSATLPLAGTEVLPIVQSGATDNITINNLAAGNLKSQSTTGVLQITGPAASAIRVMTVPNANFTAARTDSAQTFTGDQTINGNIGVGATGYSIRMTLGSYTDAENLNILRAYRGGGVNQYADFSCAGGAATINSQNGAGGTVLFQGDGAELARIAAGNYVPKGAAKGINFTANTPAAGMTSQLLNWYEEGTFTPTFNFGGAFVGGSLSTAQGYYTRIGRQVTVKIKVVIGAVGSSTGAAAIAALPFTANSSAIYPVVFRCYNIVITGNMQGYVGASSNSIYLETLTNGTLASFTNSNCTAGSELQVTATYFV